LEAFAVNRSWSLFLRENNLGGITNTREPYAVFSFLYLQGSVCDNNV
jgi:hypothetical protein